MLLTPAYCASHTKSALCWATRLEMEWIRSFPGFVSNREEPSERRDAATSWVLPGVAVLGLMTVAGLVFLQVALWPAAAGLSVGAGLLIRWMGTRRRWRAVLRGDGARSLADFRLVKGGVECIFHEDAIDRFGGPQLWRATAAVVAGAVCIIVLRCHWMPWTVLDAVRIPHWLVKIGFVRWPLLPLASSAFFLLVRGPAAHRREIWKAAIRSRAADAAAEMMRSGEIDGLEAGVTALYRQFDLWWAGEYRAAIHEWVKSDTATTIFEPDAAASFVKSVTERARGDLNHLSEAAASFHTLECYRYALETLIRTFGGPQTELLERTSRSMDELRALAIAKRWNDFSKCAAEISGELESEILDFQLSSRSVVTLPAGTDPYRVLGAEISMPTATIKKLRLRLAQVYHPDIGGETGNDMKMAELNAAYDAVMRERATR